jgi:hypothetical protein
MDLNFDEAIGIPIPTPKSFAADGTYPLHIGILMI